MDIIELPITLLDEAMFFFGYQGTFLEVLNVLAPEMYHLLGSVGVV